MLLLLSAGGCGLALRQDQRLSFLSPPDRAEVSGPLVLRWRMRGFRAVRFDGSHDARRGEFAVFVDAAPMRPGQHLDALAARDPLCRAAAGCPDAFWLRQHGIYLTTQTQLTLPALPIGGGTADGALRRHQITVVLLDGRGYRIGESGWTLTIYTR